MSLKPNSHYRVSTSCFLQHGRPPLTSHVPYNFFWISRRAACICVRYVAEAVEEVQNKEERFIKFLLCAAALNHYYFLIESLCPVHAPSNCRYRVRWSRVGRAFGAVKTRVMRGWTFSKVAHSSCRCRRALFMGRMRISLDRFRTSAKVSTILAIPTYMCNTYASLIWLELCLDGVP